MLSIFLGPDDFSKRAHIKSLAEKDRLGVDFFYGQDQLPDLNHLTELDLFSSSKVFVIEQGMGKYDLKDENINALIASKNYIFFIEEKLDKRLGQNKKLAEHKQVSILNFPLPHGREVNKWIEKRAAELKGKISPKAVELLATNIGRDQTRETKIAGKVIDVKEYFNLWQLDGEIRKLLAFAAGRQIEETDVRNLTAPNEETDVLDIINAIGDGNKGQALELLRKFLNQEAVGDEKTKIIQFNALLADQFRSICLVQDFLSRRIFDDQILKQTSWKSGRLYIMKKIAGKLQPQKVLEALNKLEALDKELKTSGMPPRVLLDMIVAQLFA